MGICGDTWGYVVICGDTVVRRRAWGCDPGMVHGTGQTGRQACTQHMARLRGQLDRQQAWQVLGQVQARAAGCRVLAQDLGTACTRVLVI